eukprot:ANDGO_06061.mRNA.1 intraflagellar transport protein
MSDLTFDENYSIRVIDPIVFARTEDLHNESRSFAEKLGTAVEIAHSSIQKVNNAARLLETEKIKAIAMRNKVESQSEIRKQRIVELESLVAERKALLDRKITEYQCLLSIEREQQIHIEKLAQNGV